MIFNEVTVEYHTNGIVLMIDPASILPKNLHDLHGLFAMIGFFHRPCRSVIFCDNQSQIARFQGRLWRTESDTSLALRHRPASGSRRRSPSRNNGAKVGSRFNLTDL